MSLEPKEPTVSEETYDVAVIGGGVAGVVAAIAAARLGCTVALVQDRPVLGGNSSNEIRVGLRGADAAGNNRWALETGILEELRREALHRHCLVTDAGSPRPEWDWILWEWVNREPLLKLYLNTRARQAVMATPTRIDSVIAHQTSTERTWRFRAKVFIDCSGDGEIAAQAGAEFRMGRESRHEFGENRAPEEADDWVLCPSLLFSAHDEGRPVPFVPPPWARDFPTEESLEPMREHVRIRGGYAWIEYGGTLDPIRHAEEIRDELIRIVFGVWDHIKNHGDHGAENYALDWVGTVLGKRESRRFLGDHILTQSDVENQVLFPDRVAYGGWPLDHLHPSEGVDSKDPPGMWVQRNYLIDQHQGRWYPYGTLVKALYTHPPAHWPEILLPLRGLFSIPFRCLYSRNIENLLFAGRNISATHVAFGATRVINTTAVMGQAVGTAAAFCVKRGVTPRLLCQKHIHDLQQQLLKDDCYLVGLRNEDPNDLARSASVQASSCASLEVLQHEEWLPLNVARGQMISFSEKHVASVSLLLRSERSDPMPLTARLISAARLDDFTSGKEVARAKALLPAKSQGWIEFGFQAEIDPSYPYWVCLEEVPGVYWAYTEENVIGTHRAEWFDLLGGWFKTPGTHCFRCSPPSRPYGPANAVNGVTRPEVGPNIWISDPREPLPQWLELTFSGPRRISTVYLTFDTNLDAIVGEGDSPECIRDYRLLAHTEHGPVELVRETGNYHRRRIHHFDPVVASKLRLVVEATNGSPEARLYEIRVYE